MPSRKADQGFTLIELCIVFTIGALLASAGVAGWNAQLEKAKAISTKDKLAAIEDALEAYVARAGRLPCPSSRNARYGTAAFGTETDCGVTTLAPGNCADGICITGGRLHDHDNDPATANVPARIRIGSVPARVLNLPFDSVKDGYGRNFTYAVTEIMAKSPVDYSSAKGGIAIVDESGTSVIDPVGEGSYLLLSYGADGNGATDFDSGGTINDCDRNAKDAPNCSLPVQNASFLTALYSGSSGANHFDDILTYAVNVAPAAGAEKIIYTSPSAPITLWGNNIACPSGWTQAYAGKRFEILGVTGGMDPTADKQAQCIKGLSAEILRGQQRTNTNGFDQQLFYGSAFYYSGVGGVFISPMNVDCTVCVKN